MAELAKKLRYQKTGQSAGAITLYSTASEAGSNYLRLQVDGVNAYTALGSTTDSNASNIRIQKGSSTYAVLKSYNSVTINSQFPGKHEMMPKSRTDIELALGYDDGELVDYISEDCYTTPDYSFIYSMTNWNDGRPVLYIVSDNEVFNEFLYKERDEAEIYIYYEINVYNDNNVLLNPHRGFGDGMTFFGEGELDEMVFDYTYGHFIYPMPMISTNYSKITIDIVDYATH